VRPIVTVYVLHTPKGEPTAVVLTLEEADASELPFDPCPLDLSNLTLEAGILRARVVGLEGSIDELKAYIGRQDQLIGELRDELAKVKRRNRLLLEDE